MMYVSVIKQKLLFQLIYGFMLCVLSISCSNDNISYSIEYEDSVQVVNNYHEHTPGLKVNLNKITEYNCFTNDFAEKKLKYACDFDLLPDAIIGKFIYFHKGVYVYKVNFQGEIIKRFCSQGLGPGEVENKISNIFAIKDTIFVFEEESCKLLKYNPDGELIDQIKAASINGVSRNIIPCKDFILRTNLDRYDEYRLKFQVNFYDSNMKYLKTFTEIDIRENSIRKDLATRVLGYFIPAVSAKHIYLAYRKDKQFMINEYNMNGNLIRKIKKVHNVVDFSIEMKNQIKEKLLEMDSMYTDDYMNIIVQLAETMSSKPYDQLYIHDDYMWVSKPRINSGMFHYLNIDHVHSFDIFKDGIFLKNFELDLSDEDILWSNASIMNEYLIVCKKYKNDTHSLELYNIIYQNE